MLAYGARQQCRFFASLGMTALGWLAALAVVVCLTCVNAQAQTPEQLLGEFRWRNVGPAVFAGRVVDVEAMDNDFRYVIAASASGGVWKSVNAGTTWEPIFDQAPVASIGDVAVFQGDRNLIWVGTGEANNRNSVSWGDGIYKSTDGGKTFTNVGLRDTFQIARIVTDPKDRNVVYAAAIGQLWGSTGERGLYKTTDGGATWSKLTSGLPAAANSGAIDLVMDPGNSKILYVAFYQRLRRPWRFDSGGPAGGIFKTTDAGKTWTKLTNGLPAGDTGRIGLAVYRKNPKIVMAIIEHGFQPTEDSPDYVDMSKLGTGIYRSEDAGKTWRQVNRYNGRPFYYSQIRINPHDDKLVYVMTTTFRISEDGGKTFNPAPLSYEGGLDFHGMWLDPTNRDRFYLAKDKGLTLTHDHGASFILFDNMPVAQFYAIGADMRDPYHLCGGTQDNGSWCGPHFSRDVRGTLNDSWWKMHWGDGMFVQFDPTDWRKIYTEAENGSVRRVDPVTRRVENARPVPANIVNYREHAPADAPVTPRTGLPAKFRFNWRAPLVMSPHNPRTLYLGGSHLFKTVDGGRWWQIISPDLSSNDAVKTDPNSGGLTRDTSGAETHCTITAISESPRAPGVIWVGTDDGLVHVTRNGGATWTNVRGSIRDVPEGIWVSHVETSRFTEGTAYVTFDGHRSDNRTTWIFKTTDFGQSWTSIAGNLPANQPLLVVREDTRNAKLLFVGSEFQVHASLDGGATWHRLGNGMPVVATHDLVIHPRDGDLIAGTHGRGIYVLDDIMPLQQLNDRVLASPAHVFEQRVATIWNDQSRGAVRGHLFWAAENPPYIPKNEGGREVRGRLESNSLIHYYLRGGAGVATLEISDLSGERKRTIAVNAAPGIHRAVWDLRWNATEQQRAQFVTRIERALERVMRMPGVSEQQKQSLGLSLTSLKSAQNDADANRSMEMMQTAVGNIAAAATALNPRLEGSLAEPGEYLLRLNVSGASYTGRLKVRMDPND